MHVTVILAVHNGEASIDAAIESIAAQTYGDWDLIVVDDGSTDGTPALVDAWAVRDRRISILRNDRNLGLPASLNRAWRAARGELIARMDADDVSMPDRFALQVAYFRAHPEIDVLGTGIELCDDFGVSRGIASLPNEHEQLAAAIYETMPMFHSTVMMRRRFLEVMGGYDERFRRSQDYDLWARGYREFGFANLTAPLVRYKQRGRPSFAAIFYATWVVARAVVRDGRVLTHGWAPLRWFIALTAAKLGLWRWRDK